MLLSLAALCGCHSAVVYVALYLLYLSLYLVGQSMLSFQWCDLSLLPMVLLLSRFLSTAL